MLDLLVTSDLIRRKVAEGFEPAPPSRRAREERRQHVRLAAAPVVALTSRTTRRHRAAHSEPCTEAA